MVKTNLRWWSRIGFLISISMGMLALVACSSLPENPYKPESQSLTATQGTLRQQSQIMQKNLKEDESAFLLIPKNEEALRWRLALIDEAQTSIDLQTYIWANDEVGRLVMSRLFLAAQRGVRVRLLVDDMVKDWSDEMIALVARFPNIQMRHFNPGRVRKGALQRMLQMSIQFKTLNRRMHNKQMVVDGCWGIVGGRNIGNPYFGLAHKYNNRDLDLLITGAIISKMARDFDEYWNADAAYPGKAMSDKLSEKESEKIRGWFYPKVKADQTLFAQTKIPPNPIDWTTEFSMLPNRMVTGSAQLLQDSPEVSGDRGIRLMDQINQSKLKVKQQTCVMTPYLIPSKKLLQKLASLSGDRRIRILVPSMASNNHTMAHSHYKKYRKKLLKAGVELYEFKDQPSEEFRAFSDTSPVRANFISLHTKAFVLDEEWVLIGSLNLDPRSIQINTEHMLLINSPILAKQLLAEFETMIAPQNAWTVTLNDKGKLRWKSGDTILKHEVSRGVGQRISSVFWRIMPVENQL